MKSVTCTPFISAHKIQFNTTIEEEIKKATKHQFTHESLIKLIDTLKKLNTKYLLHFLIKLSINNRSKFGAYSSKFIRTHFIAGESQQRTFVLTALSFALHNKPLSLCTKKDKATFNLKIKTETDVKIKRFLETNYLN